MKQETSKIVGPSGVARGYYIKGGIVRWTSNHMVPCDDVLETLWKNFSIDTFELRQS